MNIFHKISKAYEDFMIVPDFKLSLEISLEVYEIALCCGPLDKIMAPCYLLHAVIL